MKLNKVKEYIPFLILTILLLSMSLFSILSACSKAEDPGDNTGKEQVAMNDDGEEEPVFEPIQEKILDSIQDNYSGEGINIRGIELSKGAFDLAKIDLSYPGHSDEQAVLAGLNILRDNFPRLSGFTARVGGTEYSADSDDLAYITGKGYEMSCDEKEAVYYMGILKGSNPVVAGSTIEAE